VLFEVYFSGDKKALADALGAFKVGSPVRDNSSEISGLPSPTCTFYSPGFFGAAISFEVASG
jgi:hypothetical protein